MRLALWPRHSVEELRSEMQSIMASPHRGATFVAEKPGGLCGFAEVSLKETAPGCSTSPVGYLEGWYVDPEHRRQGLGRRLVEAAETWARGHGCQEMAADALTENALGRRAHGGVGFEEMEVLVHFRKNLRTSEQD